MRLCTFDEGEGPLTGVVQGDSILPLRDTVEMVELIERGAGWMPAGPPLPLHSVRLLAPIVPKRNVFCVGWNYAEHFAEGKDFRPASASQEIPEHPALFSKNPFAIVGPERAIRHPAPLSDQLDYEVELAVVIGRAGRDIRERDALEHVFGYTIANDVSVRDVQRTWHGGQWFKGKNFDTHLPLGPWIVTTDEIADPQALRLTTRVNGVTKQDSNTKHMVFPVARIIAELSAGLTLYPGDVIITGTPEGVGMGRKPPEWLKPGDVVELEIEKIGVLRNHVERSA
ncbi:MAG TPA: fumarylacetoacetate hydrolase family protein [Candidatus Limnocylindria bacterium]|nr:fumarylacetoacetate hydrolase family protein [Candidatus Limnocylindria bacterium]